jgi:hypothetical protein
MMANSKTKRTKKMIESDGQKGKDGRRDGGTEVTSTERLGKRDKEDKEADGQKKK